jgi:hypothetical protein
MAFAVVVTPYQHDQHFAVLVSYLKDLLNVCLSLTKFLM